MRTINAKFTLIFLSISLSILSAGAAFASGSYGGGSGSYNQPRPAKQIDQTYEIGKSIYSGRKSSAGKLKYCLDVDGKLTPLKRSSVKAHKRSTYNDFSQHLINCEAPETKIAEQLTRDEMLYVLYYLNKRYKLYLG